MPYYPPVLPRTNGLSVVSFVLSLLWIGGFGSLLGVIFGIRGHKAVKRSAGWQTGGGLAIDLRSVELVDGVHEQDEARVERERSKQPDDPDDKPTTFPPD